MHTFPRQSRTLGTITRMRFSMKEPGTYIFIFTSRKTFVFHYWRSSVVDCSHTFFLVSRSCLLVQKTKSDYRSKYFSVSSFLRTLQDLGLFRITFRNWWFIDQFFLTIFHSKSVTVRLSWILLLPRKLVHILCKVFFGF